MKACRSWLVAALMLISCPGAAMADDQADVRGAFQAYVRAFADGDAEASVFLPTGHAFFANDRSRAGSTEVTFRQFSAILPGWMRTRVSDASGEIRNLRVVSPTMAYVEARLRLGAEEYNDLLVFYRLNGVWRLVAKATEEAGTSNIR